MDNDDNNDNTELLMIVNNNNSSYHENINNKNPTAKKNVNDQRRLFSNSANSVDKKLPFHTINIRKNIMNAASTTQNQSKVGLRLMIIQ